MTVSPQQLPLDLGHRNAMGRDDFMVAPSNAAAVAWIDRWPDWPGPALVLYGPPACGKTHLAAVWQARSQMPLVDDADRMIGDPVQEEALFHLYNMQKEQGGQLLITMSAAPQNAPFVLPDLASRLRAAAHVEIFPPDDTLLAAMLVKLFHDRQLQVGAEVIDYILPRIERSYDAARDLVEQADQLALSSKRAISVPLIRNIFVLDY